MKVQALITEVRNFPDVTSVSIQRSDTEAIETIALAPGSTQESIREAVRSRVAEIEREILNSAPSVEREIIDAIASRDEKRKAIDSSFLRKLRLALDVLRGRY